MQLTKELSVKLNAPVWAIGMMSGTSLDGIDAALLRTDGVTIDEFGASVAVDYTPQFRDQLRQLIASQVNDPAIERELTQLHAKAVGQLLEKANLSPADVALIGFHGQTIWHKPEMGNTLQIGDAKLLAELTGITVVHDFRSNDMQHGGQGAPLVPVFHQALMKDQPKPIAVLNIGGVANVTWIGKKDDEPIAFDTGPGNALINDWVERHTGMAYDAEGALAAAGATDQTLLKQWLTHEYLTKTPPKSLDRNSFEGVINSLATLNPRSACGSPNFTHPACGGGKGGAISTPEKVGESPPSIPPASGVEEKKYGASGEEIKGNASAVEESKGDISYERFIANGAACLTELTVQSIKAAEQHFAQPPTRWLVCGGGVNNAYLMQRLKQQLGAAVESISTLGYDSNMLEAQAFSYLAVRSAQGLPLTFPSTTGCASPVSGGKLYSSKRD